MLRILQPVWLKAVESDKRLRWLGEMLRRELVVRDIQHFGEGMNDKMRADSSKEGELEREALMGLMKVKHNDEKRYYRECVRVKEQIKDWIRKRIGRGKFRTMMENLKRKENKRRGELKHKYREKTEHLKKVREIEQMEKFEIVPKGLEEFSSCKIFHRREMEEMIHEKVYVKLIGNVKIDSLQTQ